MAFLLAPVTGNLRKLHLGKTFSSLLALLLTFVVCGLLATAMARQLLDNAGDLPRYVVCMWGHKNDIDKIEERFGTARPNYVITTFAEALDFVVAARLDHGSAPA